MTAARITPGRDLLEQLQPFPAHAEFVSNEAGGVATRPRQAFDESGADGFGDIHEHDRHLARHLQQRHQRRVSIDHDDIRCQRDQFRRAPAQKFVVVRTDAVLDLDVAPHDPSQLLQTLTKSCHASLPFRIVRGPRGEHPDAPHALALLRPRRERPRGRRAAKQRDELPPFHSITSSASESSVGGTVRPSI